MASLEEIRNERLKKLELLKGRGVDPYPITSRRDFALSAVERNFTKLSKKKKPLFLVGRVIARRGQGALIFFDFTDGTGAFQGLAKKGDMPEDDFRLFDDTVDIGDFIEAKGTLFTTKKGERTIAVSAWRMLAKSLRPLPEKWHGLQNIEERFRRRYLDLIASSQSRDRFLARSRIISSLRHILDDEGYLEVETPTLQPQYGGASAEPFMTHHNALDADLFLRISDELYLKRLLVGGFPKVYEIYKAFRNEGIDMTHYPEFTMIEFYESFTDASYQMEHVEKILKRIAKEVLGTMSCVYGGEKIDFGKSFKRITFGDVLKRYALIMGGDTLERGALVLKARQLGVEVKESDSSVKILDNIFKKACRPKIIQPTFITDYPVEYLPLAKKKTDAIADAFQCVAGGIELAKGFSELNDPIDQRERFLREETYSAKGDAEAQKLDEDFIEAMEYGMPPAGGVGIGIDRLVMLLTDTKNIKEIILFPGMKEKL